MKTLHLEEPDHVPFADWIDDDVRLLLAKAMGADPDDEADFAKKLGMDAIGWQGSYGMIPVADETMTDEHGRVHYLGRGKIRNDGDWAKVEFPDLSDDAVLADARRFVDRYGNSGLALYAGIRPGTQPVYLSLGWQHFAQCQYFNPSLIEKMIDDYVAFNIRLVEKLRGIGFDFFFAYDDLAYKSGPLFNPNFYREMFLPRFHQLADAYRLPWAYHSDGDLSLLMEDLLSLGMNAINPIEPPVMDIHRVKETYGKRVAIWGNIDIGTLSNGSTADVDAEVHDRIMHVAPGGGYILASSNSITGSCRIENILAMRDALRRYGAYPIGGLQAA